MEVTKREVLASVAIIAIMLIIGILVSGKISEYEMDKHEVYNKAIKIDTADMLQYGIDTDVGNAFIYGELKAIDSVSYPEVDGKYLCIKRDKEEHTMHTRYVTDSKGHGHVETYWTWDYVDSDKRQSKVVTFCGLEFSSSEINIPSGSYIDTVYASGSVRYLYYGYPVQSNGTMFANLNKDNQLGSNRADFYPNKSIDKTYSSLVKNYAVPIFWVAWVLGICACVFGFCYLDNRWLND